MKIEKAHDLDKFIRIALITIVSIWTFQLIFPLIGILTWGFILAVTFYPIYKWLNHHLGKHSTLAASLIVFLLLFLFISIIVLVSNNMVSTLSNTLVVIRSGQSIIPYPAIEVGKWPLIGNNLYNIWLMAYTNISEFVNQYKDYMVTFGGVVVERIADTSKSFVIFILSILFSGYLMVCGSRIMQVMRKFGDKVAPEHGADLIKTMKETIQNVSRGVIGISIVQAAFFGVVMLYAGVPAAGILTSLAFFISLLQIGLIFLIIPVLFYVFSVNDIFHASIIFVLLTLVALTDTFLKPFVFSKGLHTPMMVIFIGVIGGIASYGFVGIFIGPVILALFYDLVMHWLKS